MAAAEPGRSGEFCLPPRDRKICGALTKVFGTSAPTGRYRTGPSERRSNNGANEPVAVLRSGSGRLHADEKGHLEPLPVAVDVVEAELAQPPELGLDGEQAVGRVLVLERLADRREERQV